MAALYHALGTSRILEGLVAQRGFVEPRKGIGCWLSGGKGLVDPLPAVLSRAMPP